MRGDDQQQSGMFSYVSLEERVPQDHPLCAIRKSVDEVLGAMAKEFDGWYAKTGRPSVPPERLRRAVLLQIFYTVRSERMLMEQMNYNLLFRWFVGLELDKPVWNHAVFSKNRDRLLNQDVAREFFSRVLAQAKPHLSDEHFSVDGTLIEAWASQKRFQKKDGGDDQPGHFRGQRRSDETHESKTDPEARLYRKGNDQEAKLGYLGHLLMENRHGLIVHAMAAVLPRHDHGSWPAAETGPRRRPRLDLDPPRGVPALWPDLHRPCPIGRRPTASTAFAVGNKLGKRLPTRKTIGSSRLRRPKTPSLARSVHPAALGMAPTAQPIR
jgi:transposase